MNGSAASPAFRQPKNLLRWLAIALSVAGWFMSLQLLQLSLGSAQANPFLAAFCRGMEAGAGESDCGSVIGSPQGYVQLFRNWPKLPVSALGMAYFATVGLWFVLIGPPTRAGRGWHLCLALIVLCGAAASLNFIRIMAFELHRWCLVCLATHAVNGGLVLLTVLAYPWRAGREPAPAHPTRRLVLATGVSSLLVLINHLGFAYIVLLASAIVERGKAYAAVLDDPAFVRWDYERQPTVFIPAYEDEVYEGWAEAADTVVVFSDFQCPQCRTQHEVLGQVLRKYPGRLRIALRHLPLDSDCNPQARLSGAHPSACRAARAVEAARLIGGPEQCLAMRQKLWDHQAAIPKRRYEQQSAAQRGLFADWAAELGMDRAAFEAAMDSPAATARVQADLELAGRLGVVEAPTVYLNGKLLRAARQMTAWQALLGPPPESSTQPASSPATSASAPAGQ